MGNVFIIKYDYFHSYMTVLQNGKTVNQLSLFSRCNNQPFSVWYSELPQYCAAEANSSFSVYFMGGEFHSFIIRSIFSNFSQCSSYKYTNEIISSIHRIKWLDDVCEKAHDTFSPLTISISSTINDVPLNKICGNSSIKKIDNNRFVFFDMQHTGITFTYQNTICTSDIIITDSTSISSQFHKCNTSNYPQLIIQLSTGKPMFIRSENNTFYISCNYNDLISIIRNWMCDFILPTYYTIFQRSASSCKTVQKDNNLKTKCEMLTAIEPYLELKVPNKIQLGQPTAFGFKKYPEDLRCTISVDNQSAASVGKKGDRLYVNPQKEGNYKLVARVKEHPDIISSVDFTIYRFIHVNSIKISPLQNAIVVGDIFQVPYTVSPSNAHDKHQISWYINPSNMIVAFQGGNSFSALKSGKCTITLTIGNVSQKIDVCILDKATDIRFDKSSVSVKLGNNSSIVSTIVSPSNGAIGNIKYNVSDPSVLSFDPVNGQINTKSEGTAVLTAVLLDKNGHLISDCKCNITVTPPKDIVTPDPITVIAVLLLLCFLLLYGFDTLRNTCGIAFIVLSIINIIKKRSVYSILSCVISVLVLIAMLF